MLVRPLVTARGSPPVWNIEEVEMIRLVMLGIGIFYIMMSVVAAPADASGVHYDVSDETSLLASQSGTDNQLNYRDSPLTLCDGEHADCGQVDSQMITTSAGR